MEILIDAPDDLHFLKGGSLEILINRVQLCSEDVSVFWFSHEPNTAISLAYMFFDNFYTEIKYREEIQPSPDSVILFDFIADQSFSKKYRTEHPDLKVEVILIHEEPAVLDRNSNIYKEKRKSTRRKPVRKRNV